MTADTEASRLALIEALQAFVGAGASDDSWDRLVQAMVADRDARIPDSALWDERDRQVEQWRRDLAFTSPRPDAIESGEGGSGRFSRSEGRS